VAEVRHDWEREALKEIEPVLKEELNVKSVRDAAEIGGLLGFEIKPNLPKLGPKYGKQIGEIRTAIAAADADEIARASEAGETISLGGFELEADEVLVERVALEDYAVATDAGYAGAVLTVISDELKAEGVAREVVRAIQNSRKDFGFEISDRIGTLISDDIPDELKAAILDHEKYITAETLSGPIQYGTVTEGESVASVTVDGLTVTYSLTKVL
jgi:isoleucyl-tRNA synthetase